MKNTSLYKIDFYIDTGYEYLKKVAVVAADNEKTAVEKLDKWISPKLHGETFAELNEAVVSKIKDNGFGVIYQNVFAVLEVIKGLEKRS